MYRQSCSVDAQIAAALAEHGEDMLGQARADTERSLRALLDAFSHGRWGRFWCLSGEPTAAIQRLTELAVLLVPHLLQLPQATSLVRRLLQINGEMATVVVAGERADRERETHDQRGLLEIKDDFLHQAVHDLRRPLGLARGYLSMIEDGSLSDPAAVREGSAAASAALGEMVALLDGLASIARLDDHAEVLQRAPCQIDVVLAAVVESMRSEAAARSIKLQLDADPGLQVSADAGRLRIAVINLLANAIKYAPPHSTVAVEARSRDRGLSITVTDQGPGIEPAEADRVFEKHHRGAGAQADASGLGLGLYIVRRIIDLHGGLVTLQSALGRGSTFTILLPV